jgi:hypothetical protein
MKTLTTVLALLASVFLVESAVAATPATPATLETAPTKLVDAAGTHFAYRCYEQVIYSEALQSRHSCGFCSPARVPM